MNNNEQNYLNKVISFNDYKLQKTQKERNNKFSTLMISTIYDEYEKYLFYMIHTQDYKLIVKKRIQQFYDNFITINNIDCVYVNISKQDELINFSNEFSPIIYSLEITDEKYDYLYKQLLTDVKHYVVKLLNDRNIKCNECENNINFTSEKFINKCYYINILWLFL